MAVDIRATVTCSLGTLISGSLSDDYLQGSGLVKTRGSVEISGVITPAVGTAVTFSYVKGGVTRSIPRKLRVMSSFADPYRRTTKVELGCKLTYLSDLQEPVDWSAFDDPENAGYDAEDARIVTLPLYASSVMDKCLTELGITANTNPLTNKFSIAEFDFGSGYVSVLSDLLVSESYCGYLDANEVLQVFSLDVDGGSGPVFAEGDIVDLGPINSGQLPGEAVTVSYSSLKLKNPDADSDTLKLNWEREEIIGSPTSLFVEYNLGDDPEPSVTEYKYIPRTLITTDYDAWDRVAKRTTTTFTIGATLNTTYIKDVSRAGRGDFGYQWGSSKQEIVETELTYYRRPVSADAGATQNKPEDYSEVASTYKERIEPKMATLGACGISTQTVNPNSGGLSTDFVNGSGIVEIIETSFETGSKSVTISGRTGSVPVTKQVTKSRKAYGHTQHGQQDIAERSSSGGSPNYSGLLAQALLLSDAGSETVIKTGREVALESRPGSADRTNAAYSKDGDPNNGWRTEQRAQLELVLGSATAQRRIELSMPYAPDDIFSGPSGGPFTATPSDAAAKANRYGRVQNRLLLGNRSGINLQLTPEKLPAAPFAPMYVQANGLTALYRANGNQWAFSSDGIVCSTDALFWAAVGGTGTFFFPVAPGITSLPSTPPVVNGQMNATNVVLPYNETAVYDAAVRTQLVATKFEYALELLTTVPTLVAKVQAAVRKITKVEVPAATVTLAAGVPVVSGGGSAKVPAAVMTLAAVAPAVSGGASVAVPSAALTLEALAPEISGTPSTDVAVPSLDLTLSATAPSISTGTSVAVPAKEITVAALAPSSVGNNSDPDFASVSLLLHLDGSNGGTTFTDSSSNAVTMTRGGNAALSTGTYKFGTASVEWDGSGDFVRTPSNALFTFGTGDFTIEFWSYFKSTFSTGAAAILMNIGGTHEIMYVFDTLRYRTTGGSNLITGGALNLSQWYHIALSKSGSNTRLFIDGTQAGSTYVNATNYTADRLTFGASNSGGSNYLGFMDEIRVTKGVARYTANFTAPSAAFFDQ